MIQDKLDRPATCRRGRCQDRPSARAASFLRENCGTARRCVGEGTVYGLAHASAKKPIGIVPVSPCALAALLAVVYFREGRAQDALTTVEKAYDEVTKYKLAPQFHNQVIKIGKAIERRFRCPANLVPA